MDVVVLYLKDADSIAGMLLLFRLVKGCRVSSAKPRSYHDHPCQQCTELCYRHSACSRGLWESIS